MFNELDGGLQILKALKITWASFMFCGMS